MVEGSTPEPQPARVLMFLEGVEETGRPFKLSAVSVLRLENEEIVARLERGVPPV